MASNVTRDHHNLRRNLKLNGNYISNDGGDEGVKITDGGNVGINTTVVAPLSKFEVFNSNVQLDAGTTGYQTGISFVSTASDFTAAMVGGRIIFDDGTDAGIITAFAISSIVTVSTSQTVGGAGDQRAFKVYYPAVQIDTGASSTSLKIGNTSFDTSSGDISLAANGGGNIVMTDGTSTIFDFDVDAPSLTIYDDADTDGNRDYFNIAVGADGHTIMTTNDDSGGDGANISFRPEGYTAFEGSYLYLIPAQKMSSSTGDAALYISELLNLSSGAGGSDTHYGLYHRQTQQNLGGWDNVYLMYLTDGNSHGVGDIFSVDKDALLGIQTTGTAKSITDVITITNDVYAADMDGTGSAIKFNQWYYDGSSPAIEDAAKIAIATETDWTSTASTRDSYMAFHTSLDGTLAEKVRITSGGNVGIGVSDPDELLEVAGDLKVSGANKLYLFDTGGEYLESDGDDLTIASGRDCTIDADRDIILDANGADIIYKDNGLNLLKFTNNAGAWTILNNTTDKNLLFKTNSNGSPSTVLTMFGTSNGSYAEFSNAVGFDREEETFSDDDILASGSGTGGTHDTHIDFRIGNKIYLQQTATMDQINLIFPNTSGNFLLYIRYDGDWSIGDWKVWASDLTAPTMTDVTWPGGTQPDNTSGGRDIFSFYWDADNQTCYGVASLAFAAP